MIAAQISAEMTPMHTQNLERFSKIEQGQTETRERFLAIDSNGSGRRPGILQRQDTILAEIKDGQEVMRKDISKLTLSRDTINKQKAWGVVKWILGGVGAFGAALGGMYIGHVMGWK